MLLSDRPEPIGGNRRKGWIAAPAPELTESPFEGAGILDESTGDLRLVLFHRARDVALWIKVPEAERSGLFGPKAAQVGLPRPSEDGCTLDDALSVLHQMVVQPEAMSAPRVARACADLSEWAGHAMRPQTAMWFAEAAAHAQPGDALLAAAAGRAVRQHARWDRARRWFERAMGLARKERNYTAQAAAYLGWANLEFHKGEFVRARHLFTRAYRAARKDRSRALGAAAHHNLMALCIETRRFAEGQQHAEAALQLYGPLHRVLPTFAQDVAQLFSWQGYFEVAYNLFSAASQQALQPKERFITIANLARAAAGTQRKEAFLDAWVEITEQEQPVTEFTAEALVSLAEGAFLLNLKSRAFDGATKALILSRQRGEKGTEAQASQLLERLQRGDPPTRPSDPPDNVRALANRLLRALSEAAPG